MEIKEITSKQEWEEFLLLCDRKSFLHSWNWGQFHLSLRNRIWRFGVYDSSTSSGRGELVALTLVIKISAKRGSFLLVPHGPVTKISNFQFLISNQILNSKCRILEVLLNKLKKLAIEERTDFIRICPIWKREEENVRPFKDLGFRTAPLHYHPESSWKLNIETSEGEIFNGMRKTTRYLIKQAQNNKDIEFSKSVDVNDMKIFYDMHQKVVKTQKFVPFSLEYLQKEFSAFLPDSTALFFAKYKGQIIAGSFEVFHSNIAFYHHAALLPEFKKIPVSYLLQWEAIKEAKIRGCKIYDFWGYSNPVKNPKHPYSGPTLFKMGFGGYKDEYVKTQDFIISKKYWINYIIEIIRKFKRGL